MFNSIELFFRSIKKTTYSKIYESINDLKDNINKIINNNKFNNTLLFNFKETLQDYLFYSDTYKNKNLNNIKIS